MRNMIYAFCDKNFPSHRAFSTGGQGFFAWVYNYVTHYVIPEAGWGLPPSLCERRGLPEVYFCATIEQTG